MKLLQDCLFELAVQFRKYCEKQDVELEGHLLLIRRNVSVNPISKILVTYNKVMTFQLNEQTALFRNYLENEVKDYFMIGTSGPEAVQKNMRNKFFQMIIKEELRARNEKKQFGLEDRY